MRSIKILLFNINKFRKIHPKAFSWIKYGIVFSIFFLVCLKTLDPDFGWHLSAGNYIRSNGIPSHDIFTYTAKNFSWIDHEWLNDIIVSIIYKYGNYFALSVLFAVLWSSALFVNNKTKNLAVLLVGTLAVLPFAGIRPVTWTILFLPLLMRMSVSKNKYLHMAIPLLFLLWANIHGGFIIGLAYLGYLVVTERNIYWVRTLFLSVLLTFVNPYGPNLYQEIARTVFDSSLHHQIDEWRSFYVPLSVTLYLFFWMTGFWMFFNRKIKNYFSFDILIGLTAVSSTRNWPLFVIVSINRVNDSAERIYHSLPKKISPGGKKILAVFALGILILVGFIIKDGFFPIQSKFAIYPVDQVKYLNKNGCKGNLFNSYDYGGYIIWKLPNIPVFIDGRMPSWRGQDGAKYLDAYASVVNNVSSQNKIFKKYNIQCVLDSSKNSNYKRLNDDLLKKGWKDVSDSNSAILLIGPN